MKREELTAYDCNEGSYDSMGFPWGYKEMVYDKDKADKVMDAMESRIKELEEENKHLEDYIDAYQESEALNIEKLDKKDERIKELEEQCTKYQAELMNNDPALDYMPPTTEEK